jgi:putative two-component system response regulator
MVDITARREAEKAVAAAQVEILERLALAAEYRDDDTGEHTRRVGKTAAAIAATIGLAADEVELLRRAAPLHDVGKIAIPDAILRKPGRLTGEEFEEIKQHTVKGAAMLAGRGFPLLDLAERIALTHHERWDGHGYPHGLAGEAIPLAGRIVAVADVFDALTHERVYKEAWPVEQALEEIRTQAGRQFDPDVVEAFLSTYGTTASSTGRADSARPVQSPAFSDSLTIGALRPQPLR